MEENYKTVNFDIFSDVEYVNFSKEEQGIIRGVLFEVKPFYFDNANKIIFYRHRTAMWDNQSAVGWLNVRTGDIERYHTPENYPDYNYWIDDVKLTLCHELIHSWGIMGSEKEHKIVNDLEMQNVCYK